MSLVYLVPSWFFGYDVVLEFIFAIILFIVTSYAYKVYKVTGQNQVKYLCIAFLFLAISNLVESVLNILLIASKSTQILNAYFIPSEQILDSLSTYTHIGFNLAGFVVLLYMTFKIEKTRVLVLLFLTSFLFLFLSKDYIYSFYLLSGLYLFFITGYFIGGFIARRKLNRFLIAVAFLFLLVDKLNFLFSRNHDASYVFGHFPQLIAYALILWNYYLVTRKKK